MNTARIPPEKLRIITQTPARVRLNMLSKNATIFKTAAFLDYDTVDFVSKFMRSDTADTLDQYFTNFRWKMGSTIFWEFMSDCELYGTEIKKYRGSETRGYRMDVAEWIGYIYRAIHFETGDSSAEIVEFAPPDFMVTAYPVGHTYSVRGWIEKYTFENDLDKYFMYFGE